MKATQHCYYLLLAFLTLAVYSIYFILRATTTQGPTIIYRLLPITLLLLIASERHLAIRPTVIITIKIRLLMSRMTASTGDTKDFQTEIH